MKKTYNLQLFKENEFVLLDETDIYIDGAGFLHIKKEQFDKVYQHDSVMRFEVEVNGNKFNTVQHRTFIGPYIHEGSDNKVSVKVIVDMRDYKGSNFYKEV